MAAFHRDPWTPPRHRRLPTPYPSRGFLQPPARAQVSNNTGILSNAMYPLNKICFTLRIPNLDSQLKTVKETPVILAQRSVRCHRIMH